MLYPRFRMWSFRPLVGGVTCQETVEAVTDHLEGQLRRRQRLCFHAHVLLCPGCRTYLRQIQQTIRMLRALPASPVPVATRQALLEQFRAWRET